MEYLEQKPLSTITKILYWQVKFIEKTHYKYNENLIFPIELI